MNAIRSFSTLKPNEKSDFLAKAKELFSPILTQWNCSEAGGEASLQLELIDRVSQPILQHKIRFDSYGSDRLIAQQRLILHKVQFQTQRALGEIGDFQELSVNIEQLFTIMERIKATTQSCQVLLIDSNVLQVVQLEQFKDFLPDKLKKINFGLIAMRQWGMLDPAPQVLQTPTKDGSLSELA